MIELANRYGYSVSLCFDDDQTGTIIAPGINYCRWIGNKGDYEAFDPEGGPFISVGSCWSSETTTIRITKLWPEEKGARFNYEVAE